MHNVQKCKCVNVQIESRWIRTQKNFANCAKVQMCECANQVEMDPSLKELCKLCNPTSISWPQLTSCKLSRLSVKEKISLWSWFVGWRVSELHEGVSCRPDVLKCFGLLVKQRRSQFYAPQWLRLSSWRCFTSKWNESSALLRLVSVELENSCTSARLLSHGLEQLLRH